MTSSDTYISSGFFILPAEFECFVCILPNIDVSIVCVKDKTHVLPIFSM